MEKVKCSYCNKEVLIPKWRVEKFSNVFCNNECRKRFFNTNKYIEKQDYYELIIKSYPNVRVLIDKEDYEKCKKYTWNIWNNYVCSQYAINKKRKCIKLHRLITNCSKNKIIDHINHNTFDNRKNNLNIVSQSENVKNSITRKDNKTGYTGVYKCSDTNSYFTNIKVNGKVIYLGCFKTKEEAIKVRKNAELKYWKYKQDIINKAKEQ